MKTFWYRITWVVVENGREMSFVAVYIKLSTNLFSVIAEKSTFGVFRVGFRCRPLATSAPALATDSGKP